MRYTLKSLNRLPETTGVYKFCDRKGLILYIGKAKNLKKRVQSYFYNKLEVDNKNAGLVNKIAFVDIIPIVSEFEALLLEAKLIKSCQPKYNVIWKDDKRYVHIQITNEEFPRVFLSRNIDEEGTILFGPFPSTKIVKDILAYIRRIFPYCTQNPIAKRKCFYTHLGLCSPCPADIKRKVGQEYKEAKEMYLKNIKQIKSLLKGHIRGVSHNLKLQMAKFSRKNEFEQAAIFRDKLHKLQFLVNRYQPIDLYIENPLLTSQTWIFEQKNLTEILRNYFTQLNVLKKIECYDISCIFGQFAVGSMVTFVDSQPVKNFYRRFRIKEKAAKSDFAMLKEIMRRRLNHHEWPLPDLFVIDGGKPQLRSLKRIFKEMKVNTPIIGLAKEDEELVVPLKNNFVKLKLPLHSPALHLIQRLRDEAHRFAHQYHRNLRLKYLLSSS